MKTTLRYKRPADRVDFDVDFGRKWMAEGDTISAAEATVAEGTSVVIDDTEFTDEVVKVWLEGGEDGETAHITVKATTAQGREKEICFRVRVREGC